MIRRLRLYRLLLKGGIYLLPFPAFRLGWGIWVIACLALNRAIEYPLHGHLNQMLYGAFVWILVAEHHRVTNVDEIFRERTGARAAGSACFATSIILLATLFFTRDHVFPRGLLVCDILWLLFLTILVKAIARNAIRSRARFSSPTRILVVGTDQFARAASERLLRLSFSPCEISGFVRLPGQEVCVSGYRIFETYQLSELGSDQGIDEAVIAVHPAQFHQIPQIVAALGKICLPARALVDLGENIVVRERLFQFGTMQMLDLMSSPVESLDYALLKRIFDIGLSILVLILASPLLVAIAIAIKCTSRGPVLFSQERVGLNGNTFRMYKFRTMRMTTPSESDERWTTATDPRRTALGVFLRKTSLDELPQFINVLKGDMSTVGPRPERRHFVHKFLQQISRYNNRHALKVGITGWAQVNGWRGDTSIEKRLECDLYYLQNWSMGFDLRIIAMTIISGLTNKNAY
jgi:Undecaprenyl-phosphate glucose phosphotransferase